MIPVYKKIRSGPSVKEAQKLIAEKKEAAWSFFSKRYGNNFMYQGTLVTCDPRVIELLLMERTHTKKRSMVYRFLYAMIPLAHGLLFMDGANWQKKLQAVMPVFARPHISTYASFMHSCLHEKIHTWSNEENFSDLYQCVVKMNADLLMKLGYGLAPGSEIAQQLSAALVAYKFDLMDPDTRIDAFGISMHTLKRLPVFIKAQWKRRSRNRQLAYLIKEIINKKMAQANEGLNWIQCLHESGYSLKNIAGEVNHLYGAYNALDYSITCALYEIGKNPAYAARLREELAVTVSLPIGITHKDFDAIPQTICFMQEVFRYYPVSMGISRRTGEMIDMPDVYIPQGQEVLITLYALHHHTDYWDEPDVFHPDRWKDGTTPIPFTYIPFLKGPRHCIGRHLAELNFINFLRVWLLNGEIVTSPEVMHLGPYMIPRFEKELTGKYTKFI